MEDSLFLYYHLQNLQFYVKKQGKGLLQKDMGNLNVSRKFHCSFLLIKNHLKKGRRGLS